VPANTPDDIVAKLRDAVRQAANDEKVRQIISNSGSPIQFLDAPEFGRYVDTDAKKLAEVVKRIGKVQ
jgi:tripartite-type tricarboxylate transporter receptor subunit TctC